MPSDRKLEVNQSGSSAGHDITGRDKITTTIHNNYGRVLTQLELWMQKLESQIKDNQTTKELIEELQYYYKKRSSDGVDGLEAKLEAAKGGEYLEDAVEVKHLFDKRLDKFNHFTAAQNIFAILLARIENDFITKIRPKIGEYSFDELDTLARTLIVAEVRKEIPGGELTLTENHILGMIYWLADQCFVRWHK